MRKLATIFLLVVILFNMIGYRALFYYAELKSDAVMEARLDRELYNENELITITIPLNNPYQVEQKSFERVDGEMNIGGRIYKYVKRRVSAGNLILLCIPDTHKMVLKKAGSEYGNDANNFAGNTKGSSRSGSSKSFNGSDFTPCEYHLLISPFALPRVLLKNGLNYARLSDPHIASPVKPPEYRA